MISFRSINSRSVRLAAVEGAVAVDDMDRAVRGVDDAGRVLASSFDLGRFTVQPAQHCPGVCCDSGNRLLDLVGQRCGQLAHRAHTIDVRQVSFQLAQSLALLFGQLALGDIRHRPNEEHALWIFTCGTARDDTNVLDQPIGHSQAMLGTKATPFECDPLDDLPQIHPVVRMGSVERQLHCGLCRRLDLEYAIGFVGPVDFAA